MSKQHITECLTVYSQTCKKNDNKAYLNINMKLLINECIFFPYINKTLYTYLINTQ